MQQITVKAPDPYPPVRVAGQNHPYALFLMQDMASARGEMTAIYQYLYGNWIFQSSHASIADAMKRIAQVEMHHLDLLGQMIVLLGGGPMCAASPDRCATAWNGDQVRYDREIRQVLSWNIQLEREAVETYTIQARQIKDPYVSALLARLALDERLHEKILKNFLAQCM